VSDPGVAARGALALLALGFATASPEEREVVSYAALKQRFRETLKRDPLDSLAALTLGCSYLFLEAERDVNPKCQTFMDATVFITTCFSVGYDDVFAKSDAGKAIASFVMTIGPALAEAALDPRTDEPHHGLEMDRAMLARLDDILAELKRRGPQ